MATLASDLCNATFAPYLGIERSNSLGTAMEVTERQGGHSFVLIQLWVRYLLQFKLGNLISANVKDVHMKNPRITRAVIKLRELAPPSVFQVMH